MPDVREEDAVKVTMEGHVSTARGDLFIGDGADLEAMIRRLMKAMEDGLGVGGFHVTVTLEDVGE